MGTGKLLIKVPETMRFALEGELTRGVMGKDIKEYDTFVPKLPGTKRSRP